MSWTRIRAIFVKELRDYRRNRFIMLTMALMPALFIVLPIVDIFVIPASAASAALDKRIGLSLLYMLIIPAVVPATLAAYSVVGEREQGTLEPVLTTPIRAEEFLLGKALAALVPTLAISYAVFGIFLACVGLFAHPAIADAVFQARHLLIQLLFTPLLAGWSIWVGIAISARSSDVRVRPAAGHACQLAATGGDGPSLVRRDPAERRARCRSRCGAAARRRSWLAGRVRRCSIARGS